MSELKAQVLQLGKQPKAEAHELVKLSTEDKNRVLLAMAEQLLASKAEILAMNAKDIAGAEKKGLTKAMIQRLKLDEAKVEEYRAGFSSLPPEAKAKTALAIAAAAANDNSTSALHGDAILYLAKTQTAEPRKLSESTAHYTMNLAVQDPVSAAEWVGTLPEGNTRTWAAKNLAAYWNQYDPPAVSEWMKNLSASERKEVSTHLKPRSR